MRNISRPKGWVKADAVRVIKNKGKWTVQIRRKKAPKRKRNSPSGRKKAKDYRVERMKKTGRYNSGRVRRNVAGFLDANGEFHPIRDSPGYNYAGAIAKKKRAARKRKSTTKRKKGKR